MSGIMTKTEFEKHGDDFKNQYGGTYQGYLDAKQKEYNDKIEQERKQLSSEPILKKDYTDGNTLITDLTKNEKFDSLVGALDAIDWSKDPSTWMDDVNNPWAQVVKGLGLDNFLLGNNIKDTWDASQYQEFGKSLREVKSTIVYQIGESNYNLLIETYNKYAAMSDREKALLTDSQREQYEKITNFAKSLQNLDKAIAHCERNDSTIWSDGWDYVGDTWGKVGEQWTNVDNIGDAIVAVGETAEAVGQTIVGGVTGFFKWIFGM
jgi:hypothetical protein